MTTNTKTFSNNKTGYKKNRYMGRRKVCSFCIENINYIDYKNIEL